MNNPVSDTPVVEYLILCSSWVMKYSWGEFCFFCFLFTDVEIKTHPYHACLTVSVTNRQIKYYYFIYYSLYHDHEIKLLSHGVKGLSVRD